MKTLFFTSIFLFQQVAFAVCTKPVTYLQEGAVAGCNGYLFSPEEEKKVRELKIKYTTLEELSNKQQELNNNLLKQVEVKTKQVEYLDKYNESIKQDSRLEKIIYFALGVVVTFGVAKALK